MSEFTEYDLGTSTKDLERIEEALYKQMAEHLRPIVLDCANEEPLPTDILIDIARKLHEEGCVTRASPEIITKSAMTAALFRVYGHTSQCVLTWEEYDVTMADVAPTMTGEDWANHRDPERCKGECRRQDALTLLSQLP